MDTVSGVRHGGPAEKCKTADSSGTGLSSVTPAFESRWFGLAVCRAGAIDLRGDLSAEFLCVLTQLLCLLAKVPQFPKPQIICGEHRA
jgi:hypothetical protein